MTSLTLGAVLRRGALCGLIAGLAAALVGLLLVEPRLDDAIALEEASHEEPMFSRATQVFGGAVAAVAVAVCLALVVAVVFAGVRHRLPASTDFGRAGLLALLGYVTVALLPAVKYPANPPGVGDPDTVTERTMQYLTLIAAAIALSWLALLVHSRLASRSWSAQHRTAAAVTVAAVGYVALLMTWPANPDPVPATIPADLLWDFRVASLAELTALWAVFGLAFALSLTPRRTLAPAFSA